MLKALFLAIGLAIGILIMLQSRVRPTRAVNPVEPYSDLVDLRTQLESKQKDLQTKLKAAAEKRNQIEKQLKQSKTDVRLIDEIEQLETGAGQRSVSGQGIVVTLDDSRKGLPTTDNIIHASDLRDVVNAGWLLGATAIAVNGQRITANTYIDSSSVNNLIINSQRVTNPYVVTMLGSSGRIARELLNHPNLTELGKRSKTNGLFFDIEESNQLVIEAYHGSLKTDFARVTDDN